MKTPSLAKITRPVLSSVSPRTRLFRFLDRAGKSGATWISGPAGSGKTTLVASYLDEKKLPCIWYALDEGDSDPAAFFYYLGLAVERIAPRRRKPMPLFTPEYAFGIPAFTLRYFEELFIRIRRSSTTHTGANADHPFILVFDNVHHVPEASPLHGILQNAVSIVPAGVRILLISRYEPSQELAPLCADKRLSVIGGEELRLNMRETRDVARRESGKRLSAETIARIHEQADGWVAGSVMMAKRAKLTGASTVDAGSLQHQELFDYFAAELFDSTDEHLREFLMRTATVPRMTPALAQKLTAADHADRILNELNRRNFFTEKRPGKELSYQYHPVFRRFLLMRGQNVLSPADLNEMRGIAGRHFEEAGLLEDAAEVYCSGQDWSNFAALILKHAAELAGQGRNNTLREWLSRLPEDMPGNSPWLRYWQGIGSFFVSYSLGRKYLEQAFHEFEARGDAVGALSAWAAVVDTIIYEFGDLLALDKWIAWFNDFIGRGAPFPSPAIEYRAVSSMVSALLLGRRSAREIRPWIERALRLVHECPDRNLRVQTGFWIALFYLWRGDLPAADNSVQELAQWCRAPEITPLSRSIASYASSLYGWVTARADFGMDAAAEGLATSAARGIHLTDYHLIAMLFIGAINKGDLEAAALQHRRLESLGADTLQQYTINYPYHHLTPWYALASGDYAEAYEKSRQSLRLIQETGGPAIPHTIIHSTAALALMYSGNAAGAQPHIAEVLRIAEALESPLIEFGGLLLEAQRRLRGNAQVRIRKGKKAAEQEGLGMLRQALALAKSRGYMNAIVWYAPAMTELCSTALEQGIEVDYVQTLIRKRKLIPDAPPFHLDRWPWPYRITTLGKFEIVKDGKAMKFLGRVPQKPLAVLKALIALGGSDVREGRLTDLLWPEAQGDAAHSAFTTTLQRLRALLGNESAVVVSEGKVALDPQTCWTDAAAFEFLSEKAENAWTRAKRQHAQGDRDSASEAMALTDKALALYQGHFLPADSGEPWTISMRERFRSKFLRIITNKGKYFEQTDLWEEAAACYQSALDVDDLAEELYQQLMICHKHAGRHADAVVVYHRCRSVFKAAIGISPSQKTKAIYESIKP